MRPEEIIQPVVDKFQEKVAIFVRQRQEAFTPKGFGEFVAGLRVLMAEVGRDLFRRMVEAQEECGETVTKDGRVYRLKERYPKEWLTPFGTVTIGRNYYQRDAGGDGHVPIDARCGMEDEYMTPEVKEMVAMGTAMAVPSEVAALLGKALPDGPSVTAVQAVIKEVGEFAETHGEEIERAMRREAPLASGGTVAAVSWDGVTVPIREEAPKRGRPAERPGKASGEAQKTAWQEAGVGALSIYRRGNADQAPERLDSRYWAEMPTPKMAGLVDRLTAEVARLKAERPQIELALLCDGKPEIWRAAGRHDVFLMAVQILDFYHAAEALSHAAEAIFGKKSGEGDRWYEKWRTAMKEKPNGARGAMRSMIYYGRTVRKGSERKKVLRDAIRYYRNNLSRMDYAYYRALGFPIGSGPVEAACKTVVSQRLKRSGMRWTPQGGQYVLNLRAPLLSKRWDVFWKQYRTYQAA